MNLSAVRSAILKFDRFDCIIFDSISIIMKTDLVQLDFYF